MIDALEPAVSCISEGGSLREAVISATIGMEKTKTQTAHAGRAQYLNAKQLEGVADPGAMAVVICLKAIEESLT